MEDYRGDQTSETTEPVDLVKMMVLVTGEHLNKIVEPVLFDIFSRGISNTENSKIVKMSAFILMTKIFLNLAFALINYKLYLGIIAYFIFRGYNSTVISSEVFLVVYLVFIYLETIRDISKKIIFYSIMILSGGSGLKFICNKYQEGSQIAGFLFNGSFHEEITDLLNATGVKYQKEYFSYIDLFQNINDPRQKLKIINIVYDYYTKNKI